MSSQHSNIALQEMLGADLERKELYFNHTLSTAALFGLVVLPLIPGSLSFASIVAHFPHLLGIPVWLAYMIALFTAVGVEVLGLVVIKLALRMRKYNQRAVVHGLALAPLGQGVGASAVYLLTVLALVVLLKVFPELAVWALIPLASLGAIADWSFALQGDQTEREGELRRALAAIANERNQAGEIERLLVLVAEREATIESLREEAALRDDDHAADMEALHERVQFAERCNGELMAEFNTERQALNTEIVKLTAGLDTLRSAHVTPAVLHVPVLNAEFNTVDVGSNVLLDSGRDKANDQKRTTKAHRHDQLLQILMTEFNGQPSDALNKSEIAQRLGTTRQTIGRDIDELIAASRLAVNGHIEVR